MADSKMGGKTMVAVRGLRSNPALLARVAQRLAAVLEPIEVGPVSAQATFTDDNGPKGGIALRCMLTIRLPYRPAVRVEHVAEEPRTAFDGAFAVLERQLERYRERDRDNRRRPKKYYAARRALG